jgi:hypothetical protein
MDEGTLNRLRPPASQKTKEEKSQKSEKLTGNGLPFAEEEW